MLVHVKRDELLAIAAQTAKAAPKTATSEAVLGIHVEADSRRSMLTLTATNYEIVIRASMGASVEQSGSVVISAALFPAAIASLPEQDVDLETEHPGQLTIRSGHARFRLSALSGDKYPMPELPFPDDTLPVSGLRSLARNTLFAVAEDGVPSPPMKCVRLHVGPDGLKASASNGFCIMEADGDKQCKGQIELLLPARSLKVLASLSNDSDVYEMGVTGKSLVFWSGTLLFSARLVEGKFPNIHGSDQNDQFRVGDPSARVWLRPIHIVAKYFGPKQFFQLSGILDKTGNIRGFKAEHIGISLCDYPGLVFAKVSLCEILAHQIFRLHFITVADDKFHRTLQRI